MVLWRTIITLYLNASFHVALAVGCLTLITYKQQHLPMNQKYIGLMVLGTLVVYNGLKYIKIWYFQIPRLFLHRFIFAITLMASLFFLLFFFMLPTEIQESLVVGFGFVVLYPWLRKWGWLKLFWVSGTVTYFTVLVPFLYGKQPMNLLVLESISRFVIVSALMLPFEIYDSAHDPAELRTLPQRIGIPWTKRFGYFLGVVFVVLVFLNQDLHKLWAAISIAVLTVGAIYKTQPHQSKTFTAFWVEALPMVWAGLVYGFGG
ncbi:hypothetical protein SAMN05444377_10288 [Flavobacterium fontis]|uniref:UbiA prenyltransferase family protein n=2 Tax=Flavobacterium fontis TaxID=1124188 RepID=A0A1M4XKP5_9FLAO|nr:hypothetical protein SAMN05444377_10288 [Flavobacterium fontis]